MVHFNLLETTILCHQYMLAVADMMCRMKRKCWMLYVIVIFMYKGYNQGTIVIASSHSNDFYKKFQIQVALCVLTVDLWTDVTTFTGSKIFVRECGCHMMVPHPTFTINVLLVEQPFSRHIG
jgi:hypothetical protein